MSRFSRLKMLFSITILFGLFDVITSNDDMFKDMSIEQKKAFFGNDDGSVPEFEVVQLPHPVRSKRSSPLDPIDITFRYKGQRTTTRVLKIRDNDLISKSTTGIFFAKSSPTAHNGVTYSPRPDVFDDIGEFELFQNNYDLSAITRFWTRNGDLSIMGIIRQRYAVKSIRLCSDTGNDVPCYNHASYKKRSTNSTDNEDPNSSIYLLIYELPEDPLEYFKRKLGNSTVPDLKMNRKKRQQPINIECTGTVYPKLLLSVDYLGDRNAINQYMKALVAHVNAVDTMYRSLDDPKVRLRIAGIIIPQDVGAVPYITRHYEHTRGVNAYAVLSSAPQYFVKEFFRFPPSFYNTVLIMTKHELYRPGTAGRLLGLRGLADSSAACLYGRSAIFQYTNDWRGIVVMAHELGHVLGSNHDGEGGSKACAKEDGFAMAPGDNYVRSRYWSVCTQAAFRKFFSNQFGNCMCNRPDEVPDWVKSMPGAWFSISAQCHNIFQNVTGYGLDPDPSYCHSYKCEVKDQYYTSQVLSTNEPLFHGTLNQYNERCINGKWIQ